MNWFYVDGGQQSGPVADEQLEALRQSGKITDDTLIWREGMADWQPYRQAKPKPAATESTTSSSPQPTWPSVQTGAGGVCIECGKMFPLNEMIRHGDVYVCANCKPIFLKKLGEGAKIETGEMNYAGFWIRFAAKVVDGLILGVILIAPMVFIVIRNAGGRATGTFDPAMLLFQLGYSIVGMAYSIFFVGKYGATPGKMVCNLKIVTADGGKVGYGRATGRFFAEILSGIICYIGYIMAGFDGQKRALHDHLCSTRVIHK